MERSLDIKKPVAILLLATIVLCIGLLPLQGTQIAWAAEESGSKVLVDLQKTSTWMTTLLIQQIIPWRSST